MQELSTSDLKTRQQAEQYLKIEQNTEYLTHLLRYETNRRRVKLPAQTPVQLRSLASLVVQFSYLLFTCCVKQVNILVARNFLLTNPQKKDPFPEICCEYIMEKDFNQLRIEEQKLIEGNFQLCQFSGQNCVAYGKYVLYYVDLLVKMARSQFDRVKLPADKVLAKQFMNLQSIKNFLASRLHNIEHPRIFILSLEESQIFRQYSILVKVMNNSIFSTIKNCRGKGVFTQICQLEGKLSRVKESSRSNPQQYSKQIEQTIEELLRYLIKMEVVMVEQSISNSEKVEMGQGKKLPVMQTKIQEKTLYSESIGKQFNPNAKQYMLGQIEQTSIQQRLYKCKVHILQRPLREFSESLYEGVRLEALNDYKKGDMEDEGRGKEQKEGQAKNQFMIEFVSAKGLLIVKYVTPIELNIQNTDLVMFQCNNIAYHWSNVNMELVQKSPSKLVKKKERYLSLKTITHLNVSDRPLFKLLLMLDLVMLCAKIAQPQLKRAMIRAEDYHRIQNISLKVNHMINLFIRKIERYYKIIAESEASLGS